MMEPESDASSGGAMLTFEEARILGCLLEKEVTTPDYYPMTLNGLVTAAGQKSNRDPVVEFDERMVESALDGLRRKKLAVMISMAGSRGPKYKHTLESVFGNLGPGDLAVLTELLVRNVQTLGELRTRCERMHAFPDLGACEAAVTRLIDYPVTPLAVMLPPGGGRRVKGFAHLLCGPVENTAPEAGITMAAPPPTGWQASVSAEVAALRSELDALKASVEELRALLG